ncbi:MAG: COR domain-containing protein, partial [Bacteroidota bacterium]
EMLESWLHKSGVVYYRPGKFSDQIILDQAWAIKAIYTLFDRSRGVPYQIEEQQGAFSGAFVQDIWQQKGYPDQDTHELFINFMKSCDLCFEIETGEKRPNFRDRLFMAPQLLQRAKPKAVEDFWEGRDTLYYRYQDDFIHEGVIHSFISQTAYLADLREIWRIGIQIKEGDQYACIEAGPHSETGREFLNIRLTPNAQPLLAKIRKLLFDLQEGKGEEFISEDGDNYTSLSRNEKGGLFFPNLGVDPEEIHVDIVMRGGQGDEARSQEFERNQPANASPEMLAEIQRMIESGLKEGVKEGVKEVAEMLVERGTVIGSSAVDAKPILFISANPLSRKGNKLLQVDFEHQKITEEWSKGDHRERFKFLNPKFALTKSDFLKIEDYQPYVLHFAGHGEKEGIYIQDGQNRPKLLPALSLDLLCEDLKGVTELVVLNCCLSAPQAEVIAQHIPYVVGTQVRLPDELAVAFSLGLYNGLSQGSDMGKAIRRGIQSVIVEDERAGQDYQVWIEGKLANLTDLKNR